MMIPTLIFGHLLTSSNFDDTLAKVTGGRNGYGAKLTNIFSREFKVETRDVERGLSFSQTWYDNMTRSDDPSITVFDGIGKDFTKISFKPDFARFGMKTLDEADLVKMMHRRTYDIAACNPGLRVYFNDKLLPCTSFEEYTK